MFKISEKDVSLRSCDEATQIFSRMFSDSVISKKITMSRQKASYVIIDGLEPLIAEKICQSIHKSPYTLLFDKITALRNRKI